MNEKAPELLAPLSKQQQRDYVDIIAKGGSPLRACEMLGISYHQVHAASKTNHSFESEILDAYDRLDENIVDKLYSLAMRGNIAAIAIWLRHSPPERWREPGTIDQPQLPVDQQPDPMDKLQCAASLGLDLPLQFFDQTDESPNAPSHSSSTAKPR